MDNEKISEPALTKSRIYLANVMLGNTKQRAKEIAGYSKDNWLVEKSKAYQYALAEMLAKGDNVLMQMLSSIEESVENDGLKKMPLEKRVEMTKKMAEVKKILTPQVTIKEEQMKDGSTRRTMWGTTSVDTSQNDTREEEEGTLEQ